MSEGNWSLIGLLIGLVIMLVLTLLLLGGPEIFTGGVTKDQNGNPQITQRGISGGIGGAIAVRNEAKDVDARITSGNCDGYHDGSAKRRGYPQTLDRLYK